MISTDPFQTLAEFGVAIAGFTSIVVVFGRRGGAFHPADRYRVFTALVPSLAGAFLALVPVGLGMLTLSPEAVWRISSLVVVLVVGSYSVVAARGLARLPAEARALFADVIVAVFRCSWIGSLALAFLNATGLVFAPQPGVYFFVVLVPILLGAISFARIVFIRPVDGGGGVGA